MPQVAAYLTEAMGTDPWPTMLKYRRALMRDGLAAKEPVPGFISVLVKIAAAGLTKRRRGEEKFLEPI